MVSHIRGPGSGPNIKPTSTQNVSPTGKKKPARSADKTDVVGPDFELALKSLENARSHVKTARAYFQNSNKPRG